MSTSPPPDARAVARRAWRVASTQRAPLSLVALVAAAAVIVSAALSDPVYRCEAEVTALFDDERGKSLMLDLASPGQNAPTGMQVLVARPQGQLFPLILGSRTVSEKVLKADYRYVTDQGDTHSDLFTYLRVQNPDAAWLVLKSRVAGFYLEPSTGATRIVVRTGSPEISLQIVERYIQALASTLNDLREQGIRLNLALVESKIAESSAALASAEASLRALRESNREYRTTLEPTFYIEQMRLEREINMHESIVVALRSQYELTMSRILDRDRRVTVVSPPFMPTTPDSPMWGRTILLALAIATLVFVVGAFGWSIVGADGERNRRWIALARVLRADASRTARARPLRKRAA